ncbi:MAG: hypothetical protein M0P12_00240 [Paludibacteraceae bacterium]|nr:hypothetical protein [Paludibacteraceae bacterium]MCK9615558.1 hypothetical protein [Candidatus Omnitrophota bacterium]
MNELGLLNVWWMVREDINIGVTKMHDILQKYNLDPDMMRVPSDRECVRRGIDSFHNRRGYKRRVVEKISETQNKAVFGILGISLDKEHENSSYIQNTKVVLDKNSGTISAEGTMADEVLNKVDNCRGTYNSEDIRTLCKNVVRKCFGVSKRPTGGVYMIPFVFKNKIDALNSVLGEVAGKREACVYVERIFGGEEEKDTAAVSVFDDLTKRISYLMNSVKNVTKQVCRLKGKTVQMEEIKYIADVYQKILGDRDSILEFGNVFSRASEKIEEVIADLTVCPEKV